MNKLFYFILLISILAACSTDPGNFDIGADLVDVKSEVLMVDTFSVKLSTVKIDSIPTSSPDEAIVGKYENAQTGSLEVLHYFNVDLSSNLSSIKADDDEDIFDSITVRLNYSDYYMGDTTQTMELSLYRLTDQLDLIEDLNGYEYLYNINSFPYDPVPLGTYTFTPYPLLRDTLEFRINDDLGKEIMDLVEDDAPEVETNEHFNDYLRGFVLRANPETSHAIIGFTPDSIRLKLYTHRAEEVKVEKKYEFMLAGGTSTTGAAGDRTNFNQAVADRSATSYASLAEQRVELSSTSTNNLTYIQGTAGIVTRIDFPTLEQVFMDKMSLFKAEVVFYIPPPTESGVEDKQLPDALVFYETDRINQIGSGLTRTSGGQTVSVSAGLQLDEEFHNGSYYAADISTYLLNALSGYTYDTNNGLLLTLPLTDLYGNANTVILYGENASKKYQPKLNLYFLKYDE